ncbi:MAG: cytochrome-c peroxidase [Akkermansiaceae bacterium]|nr:cytochrome-c peroxidase [Akkermansiaceae bacterium]
MNRFPWLLLVCAAFVGCESSSEPDPVIGTPYDVQVGGIPEFPPMEEPADNPTTVEGIALGRRLFYDPILSSDRTISCASCHKQENAFADPRVVSSGVNGAQGLFNAPALMNVGWNPAHFWDGRSPTLEDQAAHPVPSEIEMNLPWDQAVQRLQGDPDYPELFRLAFGSTQVTQGRVVKAIAQFQRILVSRNSRWDRIQRDEDGVTPTAAELRGFQAFTTEAGGDCFHCHGHPALYTPLVAGGVAGFFEDNGLSLTPDDGLFAVTGEESDRGKFKAPSLRNIAVTAPYMHDGRFATLEEVLDHYSEGYVDSPNLNTKMRARLTSGARALTEQEKTDIIQFLQALTDDEFLTDPDLSSPFPPE